MKQRQNNDKIVGYAILIAGLCVMGFSIASMIYVFIGGKIPVNILTSPPNSLQSTNTTSSQGNPTESLFPMFNVLIWFIMAFIILAAAGRVASIGIKMMKASLPDTVTIKESQIQSPPNNDSH
jgi:uncharacterized membrane protein